MKLTHIQIHYFRGILDEAFDVHEYALLDGPNNPGVEDAEVLKRKTLTWWPKWNPNWSTWDGSTVTSNVVSLFYS